MSLLTMFLTELQSESKTEYKKLGVPSFLGHSSGIRIRLFLWCWMFQLFLLHLGMCTTHWSINFLLHIWHYFRAYILLMCICRVILNCIQLMGKSYFTSKSSQMFKVWQHCTLMRHWPVTALFHSIFGLLIFTSVTHVLVFLFWCCLETIST